VISVDTKKNENLAKMIILNQIYEELDFKSGSLLEAVESPKRNQRLQNEWLNKGEWLSAAKRAGAERVFFVRDDPVVVFTKIKTNDLSSKIRALNSAWSLARPRILFLESPGELTVLDLAKPPINLLTDNKNSLTEQWNRHYILLEKTAQVSQELQKFHRENIESGKIFAEKYFGDLHNRADVSLIRDLKDVRTTLIAQGLLPKIAHALIGRSIFVRYLEDRGVLTKEDFISIARKKSGRLELLKQNIRGDQSERNSFFVKILEDENFTYDLFDYLAHHFNGDMFPSDDEEQSKVYPKHLKTIQEMLLGNLGDQKKLFFYAYDFDVIPLDLISAIYEQFYSLGKVEKRKQDTQQRAEGAYYTPPVLAEFVCSRVLSSEVLKKNPRILDPACGSGIFLVEAFRRIVRHRIALHPQKQLKFEDLKDILCNQITGIEANPDAARITAFSLCLALLHYLNPPDIRTQIYENKNKLPCLLASNSRSANHLHCILAENTFDIKKIESVSAWKERFGKSCADIVIGNPPWASPSKEAPKESKDRHKMLLDWIKSNKKPIGDKESSQAFLWRSIDFLKCGGRCGMLVPASILAKQGSPSQQFRKSFISQIEIDEIFNFSHVRKLFFKSSTSPFLFFHFSKNEKQQKGFAYWSIKTTRQTEKNQIVALSSNDRHWIQSRMIHVPTIWKTLLYGSLADVDLINRLQYEGRRFADFVAESGRGLKVNPPEKDASPLAKYQLLDTDSFSRYAHLHFDKVPQKLHRLGVEVVFSGKRLLFKKGITEKGENKGIIIARYEDSPFCFTNSINGFILKENEERNYKIFLGIFWSSLARYFFFNTAAMWGTRNAEIHKHEILDFPIVYPTSQKQANEIIRLVNNLQSCHSSIKSSVQSSILINTNNGYSLEKELDESIFDLYKLNHQERDLIRDCCNITIPYFYDPIYSEGATAIVRSDDKWIKAYAEVFCSRWQPYLDDGTEMRWCWHINFSGNMIAVHFYIVEKNTSKKVNTKDHSWDELLSTLFKSANVPFGTSQIIMEGVVHVLTEDGVIIIKRNEKRFWTQSRAREDAESTLCKSILSDEISSIEGGK
jgi:type I restriction-modification system DNA methylase subunit